MGFSTILLANNDYLDDLRNDSEIGVKIARVCGGNPICEKITPDLTAVECGHSSGMIIVGAKENKAKSFHRMNDDEKLEFLSNLEFFLPEGVKITGLRKRMKNNV